MVIECGKLDSPKDLITNGPRIHVQIGFDRGYDARLLSKRPLIREELFVGVIDTGANQTAIDAGVAERLGLPLIDETMSVNVHGTVRSPIYAVHMYFPDLVYPAVGHLPGAHLAKTQFNCDLLLGRDFLKDFQMLYDGRTGSVKLSRL